MRKKINRRFMEIALFSIIITTLAMTLVFYTQLKKQVFSDLEDVTDLLIEEDSYQKKTNNIRVTLINPDGTVMFDSNVDEESLENHLNRPEILSAMQSGAGHGIRRSATLSTSVFYYARRLETGKILRVGKEAKSVISVLFTTLPIIVVMGMLLSLICFLVSHFLTAAIVKPIDELAGDLDHAEDKEIYPELIPFLKKISNQHEEIIQSANIRQEFTANVTHELKTPLAAISGYAELMEAGMVNEKDISHFSKEIRKSAARLLTLINDIIKLSQLDTGGANEQLDIVNIAEIAEESVEILSLNASKNNVEITYIGTNHANVRIGKELAQELIYNLIENAVRYNKPGGKILVRTEHRDGKICFEVRDTGIGIPPEHQERVFERFYRVDKSRSKELGGTGLGLAIVKHICQLTHGEISLQSEPDKGTRIAVLWDEKEVS